MTPGRGCAGDLAECASARRGAEAAQRAAEAEAADARARLAGACGEAAALRTAAAEHARCAPRARRTPRTRSRRARGAPAVVTPQEGAGCGVTRRELGEVRAAAGAAQCFLEHERGMRDALKHALGCVAPSPRAADLACSGAACTGVVEHPLWALSHNPSTMQSSSGEHAAGRYDFIKAG